MSEVDADKKNASWANLCVANYRMNWRPICNISLYRNNMAYLLGLQSMELVAKSFKDVAFKEIVEFKPIDVLFNIRNTLIEELLKAPPKAELKATDPTAISDRQKDISMLKSRKVIESDISKYNNQVGLPGYKLPYDKFKGNVDQFDDMGLNEQDPDDVNFYKLNFQRLAYEIAGQQVINNVMKANRFDEEMTRKFVLDILAGNVITAQAFVDKMTGEIKYNYVYPTCAYGILNDWNDGYNDICKGWQDNKTVQQFLEMIGNEFVWERDWPKLLFSINWANGLKYTGFIRSGVPYSVLGNGELSAEGGFGPEIKENLFMDWSMAYSYKVSMGYIEWNTTEATSTALYQSTDIDPIPEALVGFVPYSFELSGKFPTTEYQKVSKYQQQWYSSYFLQTSSIGQWIFNFGKVYYQQLEGANDEYSSGTFKYYVVEGRSAVDVAKPFIDFVNFAFYKTLWCAYHAKPEEDQVVLEELIAVSKGFQKLYPQGNSKTLPSLQQILNDLIKFQRENFLRVRSFPQIDGRSIGQLPPLEGKRNGVDNISQQMVLLMSWAESQISSKLGINQLRLGASPQERESFKSTQATVDASLNTTGYIYRMIQGLKQRMATTTLLYAQDILKFKDSIPYKWLMRLIGNEQFASLSVLENVAAHRFGIFFGDYNTEINKNNVLQAANIALQQKTISLSGWAMVTQTEDAKMAFKLLSYLELKGEKKQQSLIMQQQQAASQLEDQKFQNQLKLIQEQNSAKVGAAQVAAQATQSAANINTQGKIQTTAMKIEAEPDKAAAQTQSNIDTAYGVENAKQQNAFPESV